MKKYFYAVQFGDNDADWDYGSYDFEEAVDMARKYPTNEKKRIAVINVEDEEPMCEDVIEIDAE